MNRPLSLLAVAAVTAVATFGVREWMQRSHRQRVSGGHPALDTWESEGGNLAPHEKQLGVKSHATRPLQQQLG